LPTKMKRNRRLEWIPIDKIHSNENNPRSRKHFEKDDLRSLRESIEEHGILEPIVVQPYRDKPRGEFKILEGERRTRTSRDLGLKEIPAIITDQLDDRDQLVVMYNIHSNRKAWEVAEQLRTIKWLKERNADTPDVELARELGMSLATFMGRLRVLGMGEEVVTDIAKEKLDYSSALRASEAASLLSKRRPALVTKAGGEKSVEKMLVKKAKARGGISQELVEAKKDLAAVEDVSDEAIEAYIKRPEATLRDMRTTQSTLAERRKAEALARELRQMEREIRAFKVDLSAVPNLRQLRNAVGSLIDAAGDLETRVVDALTSEDKK
jgi:ParB/RepB/Spo0J family partition protein